MCSMYNVHMFFWRFSACFSAIFKVILIVVWVKDLWIYEQNTQIAKYIVEGLKNPLALLIPNIFFSSSKQLKCVDFNKKCLPLSILKTKFLVNSKVFCCYNCLDLLLKNLWTWYKYTFIATEFIWHTLVDKRCEKTAAS